MVTSSMLSAITALFSIEESASAAFSNFSAQSKLWFSARK
jgi:hypothetical protein